MIIIHDTPDEIVQAYGGDDMSAAYVQMDAAGCWGFVDEHGNVNIYYADWATPEALMELLAHEMTHTRYSDVVRARSEEAVCCAVAAVCARAYRYLQKIGRV